MPGYAVLSDPWWLAVVWFMVIGHITNLCTTLYLHRSATHGGVRFKPPVEHFMRFWLWLTCGVVTREWVAIHRKHHAYADREGDPHSPTVDGFWAIALGGVFAYQRAAKDEDLLDKYGKGCPDDWVERNIYTPRRSWGLITMLVLDVYLFGALLGVLLWTAMVIWVPMMGNIINGLGHALGYRNFGTRDDSRNLYPWGIWILGEELHNNHHADPRSAKFKGHWWEFDIGWMYIRLLSALGLAEIVYARDTTVRDFAAQYYETKVRSPVTDRLGRAGQKLSQVREGGRARLAETAEGVHELAADVRERAAEVKELAAAMKEAAGAEMDEARARLDEAKSRLEEARDRARAAMERPEPATD